MKLTDLMLLLIIFSLSFTTVGYFVSQTEGQYGASTYTQEFNPNQYESIITQQGSKGEDGSSQALSDETLSTEEDPYQNIFVGGWRAIKDLVTVGDDISTLQKQLDEETNAQGFAIPGYAWAALASVVAIIIISALVAATQRTDI